VTAKDVVVRLRDRYPSQAYAFFEQVRNGTGYSRQVVRTADALAFSLWPSRGLTLEGFEVKAYRGDWIREMNAPDKAEEVLGYCDRVWVVTTEPGMVQDGELPPLWGLLEPHGNKLRAKVVAKDNPNAKPLDRVFFASLMRCAQEYIKATVNGSDIVEEVRKQEKARADVKIELEVEAAGRQVRELKEGIAAFERASGISFDKWNGERIGEAVRLLTYKGFNSHLLERIRGLRNSLDAALPELEAALAKKPDPGATAA
jgi:hypothetical protein